MKNTARYLRFAFVLCFSSLLLMGVFAKRGWLDWRRMTAQNAEMQVRIGAARAKVETLERSVRALETSSFAQEQAVRQHLGYMRATEVAIEQP